MSNRRSTTKYGQDTKNAVNNTIILFIGLFAIRLINALSIATFFQPDEFFQSLEPAWKTAFGDGSGAWITWEWHEHLRSSIHPLLFSGVYKVAAHFSELIGATPQVRGDILVAAPKILQALFAACADLFTYRLAQRVYGSNTYASRAALALTVCSPWQWFCSVRTLSNSLETTLTIVALDFWPWSWSIKRPTESSKNGSTVANRKPVNKKAQSKSTSPSSRFYVSLVAAALACILRPTNLLVWAAITIVLLCKHRDFHKTITLVRTAILCGSAVLAISVATDRTFYGDWVFPPLRFLYFNIVQSLAVFYGQNRPDYYFTEGLPLLLTTALPFAVVGLWSALHTGLTRPGGNSHNGNEIRFALALAVATSVIVLSIISHKEVRFIYPLLPILHILAAKPLASFFDPFPIPARKLRLGLLILSIGLNIFIIFYTGYVHQRGIIDVMHYLRHEHEGYSQMDHVSGPVLRKNMTVGFFMPCHSTPWRSHLIYPEIEAWALTCEPPLSLTMTERESYLDEADQFYAGPAAWIRENMESPNTIIPDMPAVGAEHGSHADQREWPGYLVFFQQLLPIMKTVLDGTRYEQCWRGFNTHWHDDWRRQGDVVVWCMRPK